MTVHRQLIVLFTVAAALAVAATSAIAGPGGASPDVIPVPGSPGTLVRVGNPLLTANANGISVAAHASALVRGRVRIGGTAPAGASGRVRIERLDARRGWLPVTTVAVAPDGSYHAIWRPARAGLTQLRVVPSDTPLDVSGGGSGSPAGSASDVTAPQLGVTVYRGGVASWYAGPGLYGTKTACGVTLGPGTVGVAHRSLPCGTPVALYRHGRTVVVPVIDRGPYVRGRTWDLTYATFRALGGGDGLVTLGALPLPAVPPAPAAG